MNSPIQDKTSLILHVQLVAVGLTPDVGDEIAVNTAAVKQIDQLLQQKLGNGEGLKVSAVLQGEQPNGEHRIPTQ
jgi:hypothetical protein